MTLEEIKQEVQNASLVLVGLGEELTGDMAAFYQELKGLLEHKDYFIVTLKDREGLEAAGLAPEQITAPLVDPEGHESWEKYLHWLSFTLNQKLCVLELALDSHIHSLCVFPLRRQLILIKNQDISESAENFHSFQRRSLTEEHL